MEKIWNGGNAKQRKELIVAIYSSDVFFTMYGSRNWNELPAGIQRRLERLYEVLQARG